MKWLYSLFLLCCTYFFNDFHLVPLQDLMDRLIAVNSDAKMNSLFHFEQSHTFGLRYRYFFSLSPLFLHLEAGKHSDIKLETDGGTYVFTRRMRAVDGLTPRVLLILPGSERLGEEILWMRKIVVRQFPAKITTPWAFNGFQFQREVASV